MARLLVLAASAPLLLIGAAYPDKPMAGYPDGPDSAEYSDEGPEMVEVPVTYRPCRPGPGDDRCIQLYERGVRTAYARWLRDHDVDGRREVAMGGPIEADSDHRRHPERTHHSDRHDGDRGHRCDDDRDDRHDGGHDDEARGM
jgi:hypothetical protein